MGRRQSDPVIAILLAAACAASPDLSPRVAAEIAEVRKLAADDPKPLAGTEGQLDQGKDLLAKAEAALASGRTLLAIERLGLARQLLEPLRFVSTHVKKMEAVEPEEYRKAAAEIAATFAPLREGLGAPTSSGLPAAIRALRDEARVQAAVYERTVAMWREADEPFGSLYYGASAISLAHQAAFLQRLAGPPVGKAPAVGGVEAAADAYEGKLIGAYVPPASKEHHRDFILASASLKTAHEQLERGSPEGALDAYLKGRLYGSPLTKAGEPGSVDALREKAAGWESRIASLPADPSLACLYVQKAEALLDEGKPETIAYAAALLDDVLPEYFARTKPGAAVAKAAPAASAPVTVTLVRWPYT